MFRESEGVPKGDVEGDLQLSSGPPRDPSGTIPGRSRDRGISSEFRNVSGTCGTYHTLRTAHHVLRTTRCAVHILHATYYAHCVLRIIYSMYYVLRTARAS